MYEDKTYDALLAECKSIISDGILKSEGSLVHNAASIVAMECERLYMQADYLLEQLDPDTADYDNLLKLCAQRGIYPSDATHAIVKIVADAPLPVGSRYNLSIYNYTVIEAMSATEYKAQCETAGSAPNACLGTVTPITYVADLNEAKITEILVEGEDATTQAELLKEYKDSFSNSAFGGNVEQYKEEADKFDGIGGSKVHPVWNGAGTVKVVVISSDYNAVSSELIAKMQDEFCREPQKGYGIAPIGHDVTVVSVSTKDVAISTKITYSSGASWDTIGGKITAAIESYLLSLREAWADGDELTSTIVYVSRIEAKILEVEGVLDVGDTTLNGSAKNLELPWDTIPMLGGISHD